MSDLRARSLECRRPAAASDDDDLRSMRAAAFHKQDTAVLPLSDLPEFDRLFITQICERLYGRRGA